METSITAVSYNLRTTMIFFFEVLHILKSKYLAIQTIQTSESVLLMVIILILSHACVTIISF